MQQKGIIQAERERRARLVAEEEARRLEEANRLTEQENLRREKEARLFEQNKRFLEDLKVPKYLQAVVEEEQLNGAYILWRKEGLRWVEQEVINGINRVHRYPVQNTNASLVFMSTEYKEAAQNGILVAGVALVWDIRYYPGGSYTKIGVDGDTSYGYPDEYGFSGIEVLGNAQEDMLIIRYRFDEYERISDIIYHDYYRKRDDVELGELGEIVCKQISTNPELLPQGITKIYLDHLSDGRYYKQGNHWPFSEWVPEAEEVRKKIMGEYVDETILEEPIPQKPTSLMGAIKSLFH